MTWRTYTRSTSRRTNVFVSHFRTTVQYLAPPFMSETHLQKGVLTFIRI